MLFSTCKTSQCHQLYNNDILKTNYNNQTIERVQQYILLGVVIDEHFELYMHVRNIFKNDASELKILEKLNDLLPIKHGNIKSNPSCFILRPAKIPNAMS